MVYFAHSKKIYGTPEEAKVLDFFRDWYGVHEVVCPHNDMGELGSIEPYLEQVRKSHTVVVREYKGFVGRGAYAEVREALDNNIKVLAIRDSYVGMMMHPVTGVDVNDETDWKVKYGKLVVDISVVV